MAMDAPGTAPKQRKLMTYGMIACCAVMLAPVAAFFLSGGGADGLWRNAGLFAPLVLCVGAHLLLHRVKEKSCHGADAPTVRYSVTSDKARQGPADRGDAAEVLLRAAPD
ncbi:DUF2933 domain-containing protein [Palleronia pelagia]|uniref:DUF2933 domain-containing protein n=1 Tax=Palleronia pelagia TaxID=387096 RepID=A0A1H8BD25_9RHOB|nr:DUF2933 domain-containing protein [Palleronia pelagia]SEM80712.1 Protein of unknown function [Palleronia pelagia]